MTRERSDARNDTSAHKQKPAENVSSIKRERKSFSWRRIAPRVAAILLAIGITIVIVRLSNQMDQFARYGLPGVFLISLLGNATVILPAPSLAVVFAMGATISPIQVGLVGGLGGALGELTGYMAGYAGSAVIEDRERYERIHALMRKYGVIPILVLSIIPNPFFDLAGIAAGTLKMPVWLFLLACFVGKSIKMVAFAYAGAGSIGFLSDILAR